MTTIDHIIFELWTKILKVLFHLEKKDFNILVNYCDVKVVNIYLL